MSKSRHPDEPAVRGYSVRHPPGQAVLPIESGWDQLLYTAAGTMTITTSSGSWTIPPYRAVWIPDGRPARVRNRFPVAVRSLYFACEMRALPASPGAVTVSGFVRELLLHTVHTCPLQLDDPVHCALMTVLLDQLRALPAAALWLPMPDDARATAAATLIRAAPALTLSAVARNVATSQRTLERTFRTQTGMSLGAWRRRARILGSLDYLAADYSVTDAALAAAYATPSAFVTAFKHELGQAPLAFLRH
ncbi:helix-turn-helix domain-containing protein [Aldersonia sp. NBC_00410]|uniref:AraC family transcriptional regulator n=1 Tax=Aldersonia sp. NBC_00410 TaxID=2975954 RepID=UPI0022583081|nr:helix-turn-helix domain-containing protein [Aldersonia sp. NBC_00410]MCX5045764.1 helix-turn-helix domain-containing protein [Aldersonia sp. NBC_00410]